MNESSSRENFGSRLGFILVSAGCAIGIGNVWKFPYLAGQYGGAAFILIYLVFLLIMGIPVLICEYSIGRRSQRSAAGAFTRLEPKGTRWHHLKWISIVGNYILMMFYTTVCGWMFYYCYKSFRGEFHGKSVKQVGTIFQDMLTMPKTMMFWTVFTCVIGFLVCYFGIQNGLEKVSKIMMLALLLLMLILAIHSVFLDGAGKGIKFYLVPDFAKMKELGIGNVIYNAMSQAFFTLSIGIGSMLIFGSYLKKDRSLPGEAITVTLLDTSVALMSGFIIIPACFAYGIQPDAGPSLIFITIPNLFAKMPGGQLWGALFFIFLSFAAFSTVIAVFENIISMHIDLFNHSRKRSILTAGILLIVLSIPCVLGFNLWSGFQPMGTGSNVMDLEDFIISNNLLPLGSLAFVLFATRKNGMGWNNFLDEANTGNGLKLSSAFYLYIKYGIPCLILIIFFKGYYDAFAKLGTTYLVVAYAIAILFLAFLFWCTNGKPKKERV